uniref:Glycos_transf_1 n=1 Tax=uncultured Thermoanaerobacter sp. TaxID=242695 RepID=A0A060C022_9THEO|nr:Glycos_transf_1 [uncultured Thermoanaerobacter sp.]
MVGRGGEERRLRALAGPTVEFRGAVSDGEIARLYARARAFLFPGEEDFGITPVEAQSAGTPVLAFGRGGAAETVLDGKTGLFFEEQTAESLSDCILRFERGGVAFTRAEIREHSLQFGEARFQREIYDFCMKKWEARGS